MLVKITLLYILLGIIMFLVIWYNVQLFLFMIRRHKEAIYVPSFNRHLALMKKTLPLIRGKKLLDLGCGDGKALRFFTREYGVACAWYDINSFAISYGRVINFLKWCHMKLFRQDFSHAPIDDVDYLYFYLFPEQLVSIEDWVFSSIKKETIIISNTFEFKKHPPFQTIKDRRGKDRIFLYKK